MKLFIGIDPGKDGGITLLRDDAEIVYCAAFPLVDNVLEPRAMFKLFWAPSFFV